MGIFFVKPGCLIALYGNRLSSYLIIKCGLYSLSTVKRTRKIDGTSEIPVEKL